MTNPSHYGSVVVGDALHNRRTVLHNRQRAVTSRPAAAGTRGRGSCSVWRAQAQMESAVACMITCRGGPCDCLPLCELFTPV